MPGVSLHPQPCVRSKKHTSVFTTGPAETSTFPARWFSTYCALSSVSMTSESPSPAELVRRLDASPGASGPHAFAVRIRIARLATRPRPSHSIPRSWRSRAAPLLGWNGRTMNLIWGRRQALFLKNGITRRGRQFHQIDLSRKIGVSAQHSRRAFCSSRAVIAKGANNEDAHFSLR
jgi:hypothetical protein